MNKIVRKIQFLEKPRITSYTPILLRNNYSKDPPKDSDEEQEGDNRYKHRPGIFHDKQQSIQEESYFHKEEIDQLKELKKKLKKKKPDNENESK